MGAGGPTARRWSIDALRRACKHACTHAGPPTGLATPRHSDTLKTFNPLDAANGRAISSECYWSYWLRRETREGREEGRQQGAFPLGLSESSVARLVVAADEAWRNWQLEDDRGWWRWWGWDTDASWHHRPREDEHKVGMWVFGENRRWLMDLITQQPSRVSGSPLFLSPL